MKQLIFIFKLFFCLETEDAPKTFHLPINKERELLEQANFTFNLKKCGGAR